jgi:hypothetical protein
MSIDESFEELRRTALKVKADRDELLAACIASEEEYDEESTPMSGNCPACAGWCIPIPRPKYCAHHLRMTAIAKAES